MSSSKAQGGDTRTVVTPETSASEDVTNLNFVVIIFLMYLAVANDFSNMVSCDVKRALEAHNAWLRQVVLFAIILFTRVSPSKGLTFASVRQPLYLYVLIIMSTKCGIVTFLPAMLCALVYLSIASDRTPMSEKTERRLVVIRDAAKFGAIGFIVVGFALYMVKQRSDFGKRFSLTKFLFTTAPCKR